MRGTKLSRNKKQHDENAIINIAKLQKPVMFGNKENPSLKHKRKEHDWGGIFKQLKEDDAEFSKENNQTDDECYTNEQNGVVNKMIHTKMDEEFKNGGKVEETPERRE